MSNLSKKIQQCLEFLPTYDTTLQTIYTFVEDFFQMNPKLIDKALHDIAFKKLYLQLAEQLLKTGVAKHEFVFTNEQRCHEFQKSSLVDHPNLSAQKSLPASKPLLVQDNATVYIFTLTLRLLDHPKNQG